MLVEMVDSPVLASPPTSALRADERYTMTVNPEYLGSTLDELLATEETLVEVTQVAEARVQAYQSTSTDVPKPLSQPSHEEKVR